MEELKNCIVKELKTLEFQKQKLKNETDFEDFVYQKLETFLKSYDKSILLKRQITSTKETRQLKPDIIVGLNEILIELKYNITNLNDIYRLFYQALKYSRLAKYSLIFYVYDPRKELTNDDIQDLESFEKVEVIRRI